MGRKRRPRDILISDRTFAQKTEERAITDRVSKKGERHGQMANVFEQENEGRIDEEKRSVEAEGAQTFKVRPFPFVPFSMLSPQKVSLISPVPLASRADKSVGSRVNSHLFI